jgi:hypothetical protein
MEVPQGNALCNYLKQPKLSYFFFFIFSYMKLENRKVKQVLPGGIGTSERGRWWGNCEGVRISYKYCAYIYENENDTC